MKYSLFKLENQSLEDIGAGLLILLVYVDILINEVYYLGENSRILERRLSILTSDDSRKQLM